MGRIKVQESPNAPGRWYWELQSDGNYETLATSEMFPDEAAAVASAKIGQREAQGAKVVIVKPAGK